MNTKTDDRTQPPELNRELLHRLPKTDLHVHLDGSLRVSSMLEMAEERKIRLPAEDEDSLRQLVVKTPEECTSLVEYLKAFEITNSVLQDYEGLSRAAYELAEDCAEENHRYLEVRFSPVLHQQKGLSLPDIVQAVVDGLHEAERRYGLYSGVIICGLRTLAPKVNMRLAELAAAFKGRGVLAFDLAGAEADNPAKDHREAFYLVLNNDLNCTVHAGEAYGPASIHQAIHHCGAHRIGHGTRLLENQSLLNYVNDHRIPVECCITSNVQTHTVPDYESHPIRTFYDLGLRVTVNTDNRLVSDTTVTRELEICVEKLGFDRTGIRDLVVNGFKSAFMPYTDRKRLVEQVVLEVDELLFGQPIYRI